MKFCSDISPEFLVQAEQELFEIIFQQRSAFRQRWNTSALYRRVMIFLRVTGIVLSMLGAILCVYTSLRAPVWCPARFQALWWLPVFLLFLVLFYFLPELDHYLQRKLDTFVVNSCKRQAAQCVIAAKQQAPFIAEYKIENGKITYSRIKDNNSTVVWTRKLHGVAFQRQLATIVYKKSTSFMPRIVILHAAFEPMAEALKEQGVEIVA